MTFWFCVKGYSLELGGMRVTMILLAGLWVLISVLLFVSWKRLLPPTSTEEVEGLIANSYEENIEKNTSIQEK